METDDENASKASALGREKKRQSLHPNRFIAVRGFAILRDQARSDGSRTPVWDHRGPSRAKGVMTGCVLAARRNFE
jgi:hypothetical protein